MCSPPHKTLLTSCLTTALITPFISCRFEYSDHDSEDLAFVATIARKNCGGNAARTGALLKGTFTESNECLLYMRIARTTSLTQGLHPC